jgi:hypothetical protein
MGIGANRPAPARNVKAVPALPIVRYVVQYLT